VSISSEEVQRAYLTG